MSTSRWDEVTILRKRGAAPHPNEKIGARAINSANPPVSAQKKSVPPNKNKESIDPRHALKIENETESFNLKSVGSDVGKAVQKARAAKNLSQKELATRINEKVSIIVECESGKLINTSQQILSKLEKVLEVRLRGKNIGLPLASKTPASKPASGASSSKSGVKM